MSGARERAEMLLADMMAAHGGLTGDAAVRWLAECLDAYATERARPALERAAHLTRLVARGHELIAQAQNRADAAGRERDAALAQLTAAREDVVQSARLLLVDVPEPGTEMARVMLSLAAVRRDRDRLRAALAAAPAQPTRPPRRLLDLTEEQHVCPFCLVAPRW